MTASQLTVSLNHPPCLCAHFFDHCLPAYGLASCSDAFHAYSRIGKNKDFRSSRSSCVMHRQFLLVDLDSLFQSSEVTSHVFVHEVLEEFAEWKLEHM